MGRHSGVREAGRPFTSMVAEVCHAQGIQHFVWVPSFRSISARLTYTWPRSSLQLSSSVSASLALLSRSLPSSLRSWMLFLSQGARRQIPAFAAARGRSSADGRRDGASSLRPGASSQPGDPTEFKHKSTSMYLYVYIDMYIYTCITIDGHVFIYINTCIYIYI